MFFMLLKLLGLLLILPLVCGIFLLILFLVYCVTVAWLALFPIFSWHFRAMCKVWYRGLGIVSKGIVLKLAGIGTILLIISSIFP
jgi:hypothetical protein